MKKYIYVLAIFFIYIINGLANTSGNRQRLLMDYNWKFIQSDVKGADKPDFNDADWRTLDLPHDWSIEGEFSKDAPAGGNGGYLPTGIGWYRKTFKVVRDTPLKITFDTAHYASNQPGYINLIKPLEGIEKHLFHFHVGDCSGFWKPYK